MTEHYVRACMCFVEIQSCWQFFYKNQERILSFSMGHISSRLFARNVLPNIHTENATGLAQTMMLLLMCDPKSLIEPVNN